MTIREVLNQSLAAGYPVKQKLNDMLSWALDKNMVPGYKIIGVVSTVRNFPIDAKIVSFGISSPDVVLKNPHEALTRGADYLIAVPVNPNYNLED